MSKFNNLIAGATFLKMKLDFKRDVVSLNENLITFVAQDGAHKKVRCYQAKYNPITNKVTTDYVGDEDYSVLYFPQKNNDNVIMANNIQSAEAELNDVTGRIITKWRYES